VAKGSGSWQGAGIRRRRSGEHTDGAGQAKQVNDTSQIQTYSNEAQVEKPNCGSQTHTFFGPQMGAKKPGAWAWKWAWHWHCQQLDVWLSGHVKCIE